MRISRYSQGIAGSCFPRVPYPAIPDAGRIRSARLIGDRKGEAATLHQLAVIDAKNGEQESAWDKFGQALRVKQSIGDRAGEAATFSRLADLAHTMGHGHLAARLLAICLLIDQTIGHGDAESEFRDISNICSELGYDQVRFDSMLAEAAAAYQADRGWGLIERAFAGDERR